MKKTITIALFLLFGILSSVNASDYGKYYTNLPVKTAQVSSVSIPDYSVSLTDFGAKGDGVTLCTDAFKKAMNTLNKQGGGHLLVPAGVWLTGPFDMKDNTDLHLDKNAIIFFSPDKSLYTTIDSKTGKQADRVFPCIRASKRKNICITGEGIIDGNGAQWRPVKRSKVSDTEWNDFKFIGGTEADGGKLWFPFGRKHFDNITDTPEKEENSRNDLIRFTDCENVLFEGVTFQNSPRFHVHPIRCKNVIVDGITIRCPWNAQNGDALDLSNCSTCLVVNSTIDAGDDGICMKGGTGKSGVEQGPCQDIVIQDNTVYHAHGGFVIGSDVSGGMKRIIVRNNRFCGTDIGLRFKSGVGRGGTTEDIYISNIFMTDIRGAAIEFECTYIDNKYATTMRKNESGTYTETPPYSPDFRDIKIDNIICRNARTAIKGYGLNGIKCVNNIQISNSTLFYTEKGYDADETVDIKLNNVILKTFDK